MRLPGIRATIRASGGAAFLLLVGFWGCLSCGKSTTAGSEFSDPWVALRLREYNAARAAFAKPVSKGTDLAAYDHAQRTNAYGLAVLDGICEGNDPEAARQALRAIVDEGPQNELAPWAALTLVRMDHVPPRSDVVLDVPKLIASYTDVLEKYPRTAVADEAFAFRLSLQLLLPDDADVRAAIASADAYLRERPDAFYDNSIYAIQSQMYCRLHEYEPALRAAIHASQTTKNDPTNPVLNAGVELFNIGVMAQFDVGDFATARSVYGQFKRLFPNDQRTFLIDQLLADMDEVESRIRAEHAAGPS